MATPKTQKKYPRPPEVDEGTPITVGGGGGPDPDSGGGPVTIGFVTSDWALNETAATTTVSLNNALGGITSLEVNGKSIPLPPPPVTITIFCKED